jgi:hypothetical protein
MVLGPVCSTAVFADTTKNRISIEDLEALKAGSVSGVNNPVPNEGGETIATAVNIPFLPYSDSGTTCDNIHNYDAVCPFTGSTSADVVYRYSPAANTEIGVDLCNSGYDTKVYVYENSPSTLVACNDDACGSDGFRSELLCVPLGAGNTYYIVVDGYFGACGAYDLNVWECHCDLFCPPASQLEGEPICFDGYKDAYNAGCNSTPSTFSTIACDDTGTTTMCGEYGGYFHSPSGFDYRDTDWYELDPSASAGASLSCRGQYPSLFGYINAALGCNAPVFQEFLAVGSCDPADFVLPANPVWLFVATSGFGSAAGACGGTYVIEVNDYPCGPVSVVNASWGEIKGKYSQK